jgi:predicted RNA-binding Zn-ribbon protein involved in translation (DUF1610 family)
MNQKEETTVTLWCPACHEALMQLPATSLQVPERHNPEWWFEYLDCPTCGTVIVEDGKLAAGKASERGAMVTLVLPRRNDNQ